MSYVRKNMPIVNSQRYVNTICESTIRLNHALYVLIVNVSNQNIELVVIENTTMIVINPINAITRRVCVRIRRPITYTWT